MLARGMTLGDFFDGLYCNRDSSSSGRQMCAHCSDPDLNILSMSGPVGNSILHAVGVATTIKTSPSRPIVLASMGEGATQEGDVLESFAEAVRSQLPVLFLVEDNGWAISTPTQTKTVFSLPQGPAKELFGMPIVRVNGRNPIEAHDELAAVIAQMRLDRRPAFVVFEVERLADHTNADDQRIYREEEDILRARETGDPIINTERHLLESGVSEETLRQMKAQVNEDVDAAEDASSNGPEPVATRVAKQPIHVELTHPSHERRGAEGGTRLTMKDAMREVLRNQITSNSRVVLYGEDIEDPKGDVFGVTKGLSTAFARQVKNSPLAESTILGVSIGRALAGDRPVAFIQFADFLMLAYNQIASDLGSIYWRTNGQCKVPVIVMIPCGGYRAGLGPFHSHSLESVMAHVPGVDVFMPSTAEDAAGMLNAAFRSNRPTLFFYPKALINDPTRDTSVDVDRQFTPIGVAKKVRAGRDITFVAWGNTVRLCEKAADALDKVGVEAEVLDLRSLSPWDQHAVISSAEKTARLIVVHEDNHTCGLGAEVLATVVEKTRVPVSMRRITRPDTYLPCNFANQIDILPSFKSVLSSAAELLDLELSWIEQEAPEEGICVVEAIGSGPADETVIVTELMVRTGDTIQRGDTLGLLEASKSVFELISPEAGTLEQILAAEGETIAVGEPLLRIRLSTVSTRSKPVTQERHGEPSLKRKPSAGSLRVRRRKTERRAFDVGMSSVASVSGSRVVTNADIAGKGVRMTTDDIVRRTGIRSRNWIAEGENAVDMAVKASWEVLDRENLILSDLDLVICSTTSPTSVTPSMACRVLNGLSRGRNTAMLQAYDINAACSGYLYALQAGYDYLQSTPDGRVLIVTAEVLSPLLDPSDLDTAILFGDASSATVLYGETLFGRATARLHRPELSAKGEDGSTLSVPFRHDGYIQMKGRKVFTEAVRSMVASLNRVCSKQDIQVDDLNLVVPHQANQRIIDAIQRRIGAQVYSNIEQNGNTSSSSIPLCLAEVLPNGRKGDRLGLCAFGGGFTFGAGLVEV